MFILLTLALASFASAREVFLLNPNWRFELQGSGPSPSCPNNTFPINLNGKQCLGLSQVGGISNLNDCIASCCDGCEVYQWCQAGAGCDTPGECWVGALPADCPASEGWLSGGRNSTGPPAPPGDCSEPWCDPQTDDSAWRSLNLPHDFVVEGNFSEDASKSQGYLPFGVGFYRKHMALDASLASQTLWLDFEGMQTASTVFINGFFVGTHAYG